MGFCCFMCHFHKVHKIYESFAAVNWDQRPIAWYDWVAVIWHNLNSCLDIFLKKLEKTTKVLNIFRVQVGRHGNRTPPKVKAVPFYPTCSIICITLGFARFGKCWRVTVTSVCVGLLQPRLVLAGGDLRSGAFHGAIRAPVQWLQQQWRACGYGGARPRRRQQIREIS
jgi:hypothetical protein